MDICVETNDIGVESINLIKDYFKVFFSSCSSDIDYFVIAPTENKDFTNCVNKYSNMLNIKSTLTDDERGCTAGKCLSSIVNNSLVQAVLIKSSVLFFAVADINSMAIKDYSFDYKKVTKFKSLALVLHEIGHTRETRQSYLRDGTITNQVAFDLNDPKELTKYKIGIAKSLFGEYYAERFSHSIVGQYYFSNEKEVFNKLLSTYKIERIEMEYERIYAFLYSFSIFVGQKHSIKENFVVGDLLPSYNNYFDVLKKYEYYILNLYQASQDTYNDSLMKFQKIIDEIFEFDIRNYHN